MALTANVTDKHKRRSHTHGVALKSSSSADTYYLEAAVGLDLATGYAEVMNDSANQVFLGFVDHYANVGSSSNEAIAIAVDPASRELTVTGVTGVTDNFKNVYVTADDTFTLTPPTDDRNVLGFVLQHVASTTARVATFSLEMARVFNVCGLHTEIIEISARPGNAGYIFGSATIGRRLCGHGKIVSIAACSVNPAASAEGATNPAITPYINGAACTGSVTITGANIDIYADSVAPAAVTAGNTFSDGDILALQGSAAFTGDVTYTFLIEIARTR